MLKIKYLLLVTFLVSYSIVHAYAQPARRNHLSNNEHVGKFKYGIKTGVSAYKYDPGSDHAYSDGSAHYVARFHGGIFGEYAYGEKRGIYIEVAYVGKGTKLDFDEGKVHVGDGKEAKKAIINLDYLVLSTTVTGYLADTRNLFWSIGVYTGYMLSAKSRIGSDTSSGERVVDVYDLTKRDDLQRLDIGLTCRVGYEFDIGALVEMVMDFGFRQIYKDIKASNDGIGVSVGYNFAKLF